MPLPLDFQTTLTNQGYDPPLVQALIDVIDSISESCPSDNETQLCHLMKTFLSEHPTFSDRHRNDPLTQGNPWADGQYGTLYQTKFQGKQVLTKTTKMFSVDMIREVFINMVIINSFLLNKQLTHHLVPTIGMYVIPQINTEHQKEFYINMVQLCVDGDTLYKRLHNNGIRLDHLKEVVGQIFSTLTILQESPFQLRHNDVHTKNVIITTTNQAYLIDYGLSTFTYGKFYELKEDNTLENHYYHFEDYRHIGALDMFHLFYTIRENATNAPDDPLRTEIIAYATDILDRLVYRRFWESETEHIDVDHMIRIIGFDVEPIRDINWFYYLLDGLDKKAGMTSRAAIHHKNTNLLKVMNYRWFLENFCTEPEYHVQWRQIDMDVKRFRPLISIPKVFDDALNHTTGVKHKNKKRMASHKKRKPSHRKREMSHKKRPRKQKA